MRILGIDYGTKRVGLAIGDTDTKLAMPLRVLINDAQFWDMLATVVREEGIETFVVGSPTRLRGGARASEAEQMVDQFVAEASKRLAIPITLEDERFSTDLAARLIGANGKDRDAVAAAIVLQSYLDRTDH